MAPFEGLVASKEGMKSFLASRSVLVFLRPKGDDVDAAAAAAVVATPGRGGLLGPCGLTAPCTSRFSIKDRILFLLLVSKEDILKGGIEVIVDNGPCAAYTVSQTDQIIVIDCTTSRAPRDQQRSRISGWETKDLGDDQSTRCGRHPLKTRRVVPSTGAKHRAGIMSLKGPTKT